MQRFNELAYYLLVGREIEFAYKGKQYSITNGNRRWMLLDICNFEERELLVKNVGK